jgi:hypothetical protein
MCKKLLLACFINIFTLSTSEAVFAEEGYDRLYKLYGPAPIGSRMRTVEAESYVPFNKNYSQFSTRQKEIYRQDFKGIKPDQIPPFPQGGIQEIYVPLIEANYRLGGNGELMIFADIDEEGVTQKVTVYFSPTEKLAELATAVLFNTQFDPATCRGEPCVMEFPFLYNVPQRFRHVKTLHKEDAGG